MTEQRGDTRSEKNSLQPHDSHQHTLSLTDDELLRYSRQVLLDDWDISAQERLKASAVIIVGAGGLGCPASETLARAGVGKIHIIDDDVIEASNLQRQTLFNLENVGSYKSATACMVLKEINPFIQVTHSTKRITKENAYESLGMLLDSSTLGSTLLLDCTDNFAARVLLNQLSVTLKLPLLSAAAIATSGQLALYEPYKHTGCYHCVFGDVLKNGKSIAQNCATSGVLASTTTVMGNLQANMALQYLGRQHNPLAGRLLLWNGTDMSQNILKYQQDPRCNVCTDLSEL